MSHAVASRGPVGDAVDPGARSGHRSRRARRRRLGPARRDRGRQPDRPAVHGHVPGGRGVADRAPLDPGAPDRGLRRRTLVPAGAAAAPRGEHRRPRLHRGGLPPGGHRARPGRLARAHRRRRWRSHPSGPAGPAGGAALGQHHDRRAYRHDRCGSSGHAGPALVAGGSSRAARSGGAGPPQLVRALPRPPAR